MKTYGERCQSVNAKLVQLKRKRRGKKAVVSGICLMLVAAIALALFWPYNTEAPGVRKYSGSPYYNLIKRINEATYEKPRYKNFFEQLTSQFVGVTGGAVMEGIGGDSDAAVDVEKNDGLGFPEEIDPGATNANGSYVEVTDNQVQGVIEADIIKRSDKYIFYLRGEELSAYSIDGLDSKILSRYSLTEDKDFWYSGELEMYLSQDCTTITIVGNSYDKEYKKSRVCVMNLDVSNPVKIKESGCVFISGSQLSSRVVDGDLLVMSKFSVDYDKDFNIESTYLPQIGQLDNMVSVDAENIYCPEKLSNTRYTVVCKLDGKSLEVKDSAAFLSYSENVYVSQNNIYATRTYTVKDQKYASRQMTEISSLSYRGEKMEYQGSVTLEGTVKNQYSMDEHEGILRVVTSVSNTTLPEWDRERNASLYCVSLEDFSVVASVEKFAPAGEQAESVRFDGKHAYVCTAVVIELTDPVYFFDLSDLNNITYKDTGTIEGYSSSLVNFGDGLLLGIGYNNGWGLKMEMYAESADGVVSLAAFELDAAFSEAYKSYLIDRENRMVGLGIAEWTGEQYYLLLLFDGYQFVEVARIPISGGLENARAVLIEDCLYVLSHEFCVKQIW